MNAFTSSSELLGIFKSAIPSGSVIIGTPPQLSFKIVYQKALRNLASAVYSLRKVSFISGLSIFFRNVLATLIEP